MKVKDKIISKILFAVFCNYVGLIFISRGMDGESIILVTIGVSLALVSLILACVESYLLGWIHHWEYESSSDSLMKSEQNKTKSKNHI